MECAEHNNGVALNIEVVIRKRENTSVVLFLWTGVETVSFEATWGTTLDYLQCSKVENISCGQGEEKCPSLRKAGEIFESTPFSIIKFFWKSDIGKKLSIQFLFHRDFYSYN